MSVNEKLNIANLAMQKYFNAAVALPYVGATLDDIKDVRQEAIEAIADFVIAKKELHEPFTPYEEKCISTFDAANIIAYDKITHKEGDHCHEHG